MRAREFSEQGHRNLQRADYAQLVENDAGSRTEPNIRNKLARGKFTAVFLIQCLEAIGCHTPRLQDS